MPKSAPALLGVADAMLAELHQLQDWITQLRADLVESDRKRTKLACALDSAVSALEPEDREPYEQQIKALLGALGRAQPGRPQVIPPGCPYEARVVAAPAAPCSRTM